MTFETGKPKYGDVLNVRRLPARLLAEEAAALLGVKAHDIPILVRLRLLKPLGAGPRNCVKYFWSKEIEALAQDRAFLDKATRALVRCRKVDAASPEGEPKGSAVAKAAA